MTYLHQPLINQNDLAIAKRELGPALSRILGYYRQDGVVSVTRIEDAMAKADATDIVLPAHTLKGESRQFGAARLAALAQHIEMTARDCMEKRLPLPGDLLPDVARLRPLFHETVTALEGESVGATIAPGVVSPARQTGVPVRRPTFGRRNA